MTGEEIKNLINAASAARMNAYAPYSGFYVGCAVMTSDGVIYTGANVENSSYPVGICAERSAFAAAVSAGEHNFAGAAIVGGKGSSLSEHYCFPCGMCRQFIAEFCKEDFPLILARSEEDYQIHTLSELLPNTFYLTDIKSSENP